MLTLLVGTPGSGKTLLAIDKIIKINSGEAKEFENIEYIYNNISGFKFEKYIDSKIKNEKLVFNSLYVHLKVLYSLFIQNEHKDNLDEILQNYCRENHLLNSYFIIDEAHNFFDNQDKVKNWWFTYHRHLNHEILLITQNKSLINTQYRNIPELFIKAQPRSKAISKNVLRYFNYTDYRMTQKFSTSEIRINNTYFELYTSGNKSNQKQVGLILIRMFILFVISLIILFSYFVYKFWFSNGSFPIEQNLETATLQDNTPLIKNEKRINTAEKNEIIKKLFKFSCFENFCYSKINDETVSIPYSILKNYITTGENIFLEKRTKRLNVYLILNEDTFNFLQGVRNEKNLLNNNVLNVFNDNQSGATGN